VLYMITAQTGGSRKQRLSRKESHLMYEFANKANLRILIMKIIYKHSYVAGRSAKLSLHCTEKGVSLPFSALDELEYSAATAEKVGR